MAIAFNTYTGGSSITQSHTTAGADRILIVGTFNGNFPTNVTGVTYNGVAMTQLIAGAGQGNWDNKLWYLVNPTIGSNNIVATLSGGGAGFSMNSVSYTGVLQSAPTIFNSAQSPASANTSTVSVTTTAANSWLTGYSTFGGGTVSAGTATTLRGGSAANVISVDSGGTVAIGSVSLRVNCTQTDSYFFGVLVLAPVVVPAPAIPGTNRSIFGGII